MRDAARGVFTGSSGRATPKPDVLPDVLDRLHAHGSAFSERAQTIVQGLQGHADLDCRFLGVRLSFSDFYKGRREQAQGKA